MRNVVRFINVAIILVLLIFINPVLAQYSAQIYASKDASVYSITPNTNYGSTSFLGIQNSSDPNNGQVESLIYFDLSSIPSNAVITSAYLDLYCISFTAGTVIRIARIVDQPLWNEIGTNGVTWNNMPGNTTSVPTAIEYYVTSTSYSGYDVTEFAKTWYSSPSVNNGFKLLTPTTDGDASFYSKEYSSNTRPYLIVNYNIIPSVPVPYLPVNTSIDNPINPIITWKSADYAQTYHLQVSTDANFSSLVYDKSGITGTSQQVSNLSHGTTYYWHVNATNSTGSSAYSSPPWSFTTIFERSLVVTSVNPSSGVNIVVSPNDNNGNGNGTTQFARTYDNITSVTLTAPTTASGNNFQKWQEDGVDYSTSNNVNVVMNMNHIMTAVYQTPVPTTKTLTISSINPASGVSITVSPNDNNNQGNGTTQFQRTYNNGTSVNLSAPLMASGNLFQKWQSNGSDYSTNQNISVDMNSDYTLTAVYAAPNNNLLFKDNLDNVNGWTTIVYQGEGSFSDTICQSENCAQFYMNGAPGVVYTFKKLSNAIPKGSILEAKWYYETSGGIYPNSENSDGGIIQFFSSIPTDQNTISSLMIDTVFTSRYYPMRQWNTKKFTISKDIPSGSYIAIGGAVWPDLIKNNWDYIRVTLLDPIAAPIATNPTNVTNNSFIANWNGVINATGYFIDVSTDTFKTFVPGYQYLNVNNTTSYNVTGLNVDTKYNYRITAYSSTDTSVYSNTSPSAVTAIEQIGNNAPITYSLSQNYPNPFNPTTVIEFSIPKESAITLDVFNSLGEKVRTLIKQELSTGKYRIKFDANNLSSGIYYYRLSAGSFIKTGKMILMK